MSSWKCGFCGDVHDRLPDCYAFDAPYHWADRSIDPASEGCFLDADYCIIDNRDYFIRGVIEIPVIGSEDVFVLGVWSSLSRTKFYRERELAQNPMRVHEPPYFGWFSNRIWQYPETLNLKCKVHSRLPGESPWIELQYTDYHPLAVEQRNGITRKRFYELSEQCLHGWVHPESGVEPA